MSWKIIGMALMMLAASSVGSAEPVDQATPSQRKAPPVSDNASYFEGVWSGRWEGERGEVTVVVGVKTADGSHYTGFSSGIGTAGDGTPLWPFSISTTGREEGDAYKFEYRGEFGYKREVTLKKYKDNKVKIRLEWLGPNMYSKRPAYWETYLTRK